MSMSTPSTAPPSSSRPTSVATITTAQVTTTNSNATASTTTPKNATSSGKRGRPESLVRQYWLDINEDGIGPKCMFCDHRSQTKIFRAPPATRHTLICKNAPEDIKERLRRLTNNKYSRRASSNANNNSTTTSNHNQVVAAVAAAAVNTDNLNNSHQQRYNQNHQLQRHSHNHNNQPTQDSHDALTHDVHVGSPTTPVTPRDQRPSVPLSPSTVPPPPPTHQSSSQSRQQSQALSLSQAQQPQQHQTERRQQASNPHNSVPPPLPSSPPLSPPPRPSSSVPPSNQSHSQHQLHSNQQAQQQSHSTGLQHHSAIPPVTSSPSLHNRNQQQQQPPPPPPPPPPPHQNSTASIPQFNFKRASEHPTRGNNNVPSLSSPQQHQQHQLSSTAIAIQTSPQSTLTVQTPGRSGVSQSLLHCGNTSIRSRHGDGSPSSPSQVAAHTNLSNISPEQVAAAAAAVAAAGTTPRDIMYHNTGDHNNNSLENHQHHQHQHHRHHQQHQIRQNHNHIIGHGSNTENQLQVIGELGGGETGVSNVGFDQNNTTNPNNNSNNNNNQAIVCGEHETTDSKSIRTSMGTCNKRERTNNRNTKTNRRIERNSIKEASKEIERANAELSLAVIECMFSGNNANNKVGSIPTAAEFRTALHNVKEMARIKAKRQRNEARAEKAKLQEAISVLVGAPHQQQQQIGRTTTTTEGLDDDDDVDSEESGDDNEDMGIRVGMMNVNTIGNVPIQTNRRSNGGDTWASTGTTTVHYPHRHQKHPGNKHLLQ